MSYRKLIYHAVFSTWSRYPAINETHAPDLYAYMAKIIQKLGGFVHIINGMPDHVHLLFELPADIDVARGVKEVKQHSSAWLRENPDFPQWSGWRKEYSVFTCSTFYLKDIIKYIEGQQEHHKRRTYADEMKDMLTASKVEFDEKYI
ncbi:MAG: transposase [Prevotella sp.]|nr:transposase [Prevotella sp.]